MTPLYDSYRDSFRKHLYRTDTGERVIGAPVVCTFAGADIRKVIREQHPQNVFFRLNAALRVLDEQGCAISTLQEILTDADTFIPVFCINDEATADALAAFTYQNHIADATVCVPYGKRQLSERILLHAPMLRRMVDCRSLTEKALAGREDYLRLAGDVWQANAMMALLPASLCTRAGVFALQHRFVQVFADCGNFSPAPATLAGVNGVLCDAPARAYELFDRLPTDTVTRRVLVYAHKGLQNEGENPENTRTSVRLAREVGMDGAEIDIKLSRDGVPILMHDFSTNKMLNTAPGQIFEELLWDDIRVMERVRHPGEYVDRLEDALQEIQGDGDFSLMIEFKPREGYYHIERMSHMLRSLVDETGLEHHTVITMGETPPNVNYVQTILPRIPKVLGLWENTKDPQGTDAIEAMLYRLSYRLAGKTAVPTLEDVMVNRAFGEQARLRGLPPFVWMRGDYYYPSRWEDACHRSDDALVSGFFGSCADHAARYFHLPIVLSYDEEHGVCGLLRSGETVHYPDAQRCDLGDGYYTYTVTFTLPMGRAYALCTEARRI